MLFSRGNLKMHLGDKNQNHQRGTNVTSRMAILRRTYCRTFYFLFHMLYGLTIWYILYFYNMAPMAPTIFSPPALVLAAEHPYF